LPFSSLLSRGSSKKEQQVLMTEEKTMKELEGMKEEFTK
jgi:hypothetical protein